MQDNIQNNLDLFPGMKNNSEDLTTVAQRDGKHTIWINEEERVAAFRAVEGYTAQAFTTHECFMSYLLSLQKHGFRFR